MADHPDVPTDVLDAAMCSAGGRALLGLIDHLAGDEVDRYRGVRADLSDALAAALAAWVNPPGARRPVRDYAPRLGNPAALLHQLRAPDALPVCLGCTEGCCGPHPAVVDLNGAGPVSEEDRAGGGSVEGEPAPA